MGDIIEKRCIKETLIDSGLYRDADDLGKSLLKLTVEEIERLEAENKELRGMNRDIADAYKWSSTLLQKKENLISEITNIKNPFFVSRGSKNGFQVCKDKILSIINGEGE